MKLMRFLVGASLTRQATCFVRHTQGIGAATAGARAPSRWTSSGVGAGQLGSATLAAPEVASRYLIDHPENNVPPHIAALVGRDLHLIENHPIFIIRQKIQDYFASLDTEYMIFNGEDPIVTTTQCFDDLLIPPEHPGRQPSDTYYIDDKTLLRTHTSAHQSEHLRQGYEAFLCTGDVYRRDEIDRSHFPAFHQMEWVKSDACKMIGDDLKATLDGLVDVLFPGCERRWAEDYFPFTEPSFELEVLYEGEWLEILGCGVIHTDVLKNVGMEDRHGWAFGLGKYLCVCVC